MMMTFERMHNPVKPCFTLFSYSKHTVSQKEQTFEITEKNNFPVLASHTPFYPRQELSSGFRFRTTMQKLLYLHLWNLAHIWALCPSCAFWGSYCHCIYSLSIIMKNEKKLIFFVSGPKLPNGCAYLHEILS